LQPEDEEAGARSTARAVTLDSQERIALLDRARRLLQPEDEASGVRSMPRAAPVADPQERNALLDQARRLLESEDEPSDARSAAPAATPLDPRERNALLDQARRLLQPGENISPASLEQRKREASPAHGRRSSRPGTPAPGSTADPQKRAAILARAQRLLRRPDVAVGAPSESRKRGALLAWARRLEAPEPGTREAALGPKTRDALTARVRRVLRPVRPAPASDPVQADPKAMLTRAEYLLGREAAGTDASQDRRQRSPLLRPERPANQISRGQLLQQARAAAREGRLDEAETIFVQLLDADGRDARALTELLRLYVRQRRWADAADVSARLATEQPASTEPRLMLARALLEDGRLEMAQRVFAELAVREPDNPATWRSLGRIYGRLGNWLAAREAWSLVTEIDPGPFEARLELAEACRQAGDADAAQAELKSILALDPDHRGALALLGRVQRIRDPEASLACWSRLADLDPAAIEPWLQVARIHLQHQRLEDAEAGFRAVLDRNATHGEALASLGRILEQRDPEAALDWFARWSESDPTSVGPWLGTGRLHAGLKQSALAETAFRRALELAPSNVETLTAVGRFYSASGRFDEAIELWSRVQELAPDLLEPKLQVARIHYARRDGGAVEALLEVLRIDPLNKEMLRRLTQLVERRHAAGTHALELWDKLAGSQHDSVPSILLRARLLELIGRVGEAEMEYRRALALDGQHPMVLGSFATLLSGQQRWEEAIEVHRQRLLLEPDRADILIEIGQSFSQLHRLREAQESYDRALALEPGNITALSYRGRLFRTLGQVDASIADFRELCVVDPGNTQAWRELIFYLASAEREAEALATLEEAEAALGNTPQTWMALGAAAAAALFEERAIAYYERAIAAQPDNPACHAQLGLHYLRHGVPDGALHHLLDSRELDPANVEVARGLSDTTRLLSELGVDHVAMRRGARTVGEILVPEQLFAHVRRIADTRVEPYEPVPRRVVAISASLAPGGAERQLVNMLRGLSNPAFGLDLALFCISLSASLRRDFFLPLLDGTGVEIVVPDPQAMESYLWDPEVAPFADVIRHFPIDMTSSIAFWLLEFRRRRPQVVHAWQDSTNLTAVVAALLAGVPRIILCCRSVRPDNPRRRLRRFMRDAYKAVLDHPAVVLSNNSRAGANDYAQWLGLEPERVEVVYNGIDFDRLDSGVDPQETARARQALGIPLGAPVLGGVYRMSEEKRPLLWLDVAAAVARQNDAVHFVVCGDGPMRDEMRSYATTLGIADRVHLPGAQSNIGAWYRMMDVVMLTSRHEGLPNVLLEAQSLGVPVVAPDVGGMSEVVDQGITGWTIRNSDAASLAERVLHCLTDLEWRQDAVERAPRFVRDRFGVETMLRRNLEVYGMAHEAR
jgi:tetratricopeptide (TPR) repeat protein